jgi:predicted transcriptional regulator of viral defense system
MKAIKAITLSLGNLDQSVISKYQLGLVVCKIYRDKSYAGETIHLQRDFAEKVDVARYLRRLLNEGILFPHKDIHNLFTLIGRSAGDPEDIACTVDPFCYISHLSAMSYHGLTNRMPGKLFISSPAGKAWQSFADQKMRKDLGNDFENYCEYDLPRLVRTSMKRINKTDVHYRISKHLGAYKKIRGRSARVSTIGRTFLDMLRNPELCGGINHVLEVFHEYGKKYLRLITDDIDKNGKPIDKVRAGYILNERLDINNEVINSWSLLAQRGGSRKLDPSSEYIPEWSDKWKISLNIFERRI